MAWNPFHREDENVDPFNAPDPVMPLDEPTHEAPDLDDGVARIKQREVQERLDDMRRQAELNAQQAEQAAPQDAPYGSAPHEATPHQTTPYQAAPHESRHRDRHSWHRDATPAKVPMKRYNPNVATSKSSCIIYAIIIVVFLSGALGGVGALFSSCTSTVSSIFNDSEPAEEPQDSASYSVDDPSDALADEAREVAAAHLDDMIALNDDQALALFEEGVVDTFTNYCDITPDELGLDAREIASWILSHTSYELDESFCSMGYEGMGFTGTASTYFDISIPDAGAITDALIQELSKQGVDVYADDFDPAGLDASLVRQALDTVLSEDSPYDLEYREVYSTMAFNVTTDGEGSNAEFELDEEAWDEELRWFARLW